MKTNFIAAIDTEDDGKGNVDLFCMVHEKGIFTSTNRDEFLIYMLNLANSLKHVNSKLEVWATNLEYDIVNVFGEERIKEVSLIFGKSALVGAEMERYNIQFRDTVRHIPASVKELGELVGLPKLDRENGDRREYCIRDATITYRAAKLISSMYSEFSQTPKLTLPATALAIWKKHFWKQNIILPPMEIVEKSKLAYYGGRTEQFAVGNFDNVRAIDAASMYPYAMSLDCFPIPWALFRRVRQNGEITKNGLYRVSVKSKLQIPILPYRTRRGLVYPNGVFTGWYVGEELLYAKENGVCIEVIEGYDFCSVCNPFVDYVDFFFKKKQTARGTNRLTYKLLLNSLYGKFGQTGEHIEAIPVEEFKKLKEHPTDFRIWNGIAIFKKIDNPPDHGNNLWAAIVTARARIRLHREIMRIKKKGGFPLYCDTDSVIFSGAEKITYSEKARKPGDFEARGFFQKMILKGKKEYALQDLNGKWEVHCKGIPDYARMEYLEKGEAKYAKPVRIKESSRQKVKANVWKEVKKVRRVNLGNRKILKGGFLTTIVIKEGKEND